MSLWTHVNGNIRLGGISESVDKNESMEFLLGKMVFPEDGDPSTNLPCGSEGSIFYKLSEIKDKYIISIFGDLRDYDDELYIKNWFKEVCESFWVIAAILQIETPFEEIILKWDINEEKVIELDIKWRI